MNTLTQGQSMPEIPYRVLVTKIGFDGHDRGSRLIATFLKDAGMEVIYTPPWQTINSVAKLVIEEDIDVIGISSLATDHLIVPDLMSTLTDAGLETVKVVVGGIIPKSEHALLLEAGVSAIFGPGTSREQVVEAFTQLTESARAEKFQAFEKSA